MWNCVVGGLASSVAWPGAVQCEFGDVWHCHFCGRKYIGWYIHIYINIWRGLVSPVLRRGASWLWGIWQWCLVRLGGFGITSFVTRWLYYCIVCFGEVGIPRNVLCAWGVWHPGLWLGVLWRYFAGCGVASFVAWCIVGLECCFASPVLWHGVLWIWWRLALSLLITHYRFCGLVRCNSVVSRLFLLSAIC